jgi:hypothetical protein
MDTLLVYVVVGGLPKVNLTKEKMVVINELAQGLRAIAGGLDWFDAMADSEQVAVLEEIAGYCIEARAITDDVPAAIRRAGLRPTYTPAVLAARGQLHVQLPKITDLPSDERRKAFRLLIALLGVADERRRAVFCRQSCTHWWHRLGGGLSRPAISDRRVPRCT